MSKKITFHGHEVKSSQLFTHSFQMNFLNTINPKLVNFTIRNHQIRFYSNTKQDTYLKFLLEMSLNTELSLKESIDFFIAFLAFDRVGNLKNKNKPIFTKETLDLKKNLYGNLKRITYLSEDIIKILSFDNDTYLLFTNLPVNKKIALLYIINKKPKLYNYKFIVSEINRLGK